MAEYPADIQKTAGDVATRIGLEALGYDGMWLEYGHTEALIASALAAERSRADEWREARKAFLALPAGHADARAALNRLAEAEDRLYNAT